MESQKPNRNNQSLYPEIHQSNPNTYSSSSSLYTPSAPSLYPSLDYANDNQNLIINDTNDHANHSFESSEEIIINIPNCIIHLIDKHQSIELASGELQILQLRQGAAVVAVIARIGNQIQFPLTKDEAAVKLDGSHYFFTLRTGSGSKSDLEPDNLLNYGLTVPGHDFDMEFFDGVLDEYSVFSVKAVSPVVVAVGAEDGGGTAEVKAAAYWTTLAPNVEDYSGSVAKLIASGSGQLIRGILWCGDVTVDRLKWGNEFLKKRTKSGNKSDVSPQALKRMKRAKRLTKMSQSVATGVLSGVVKVSGLITGSIVNSKPGKKFFNVLPGEIILASLDGFNKVCDAVEVAGKNVMETTSTVTTDYVSHRHGEDAAKVTHEGMNAAGHAIGTAWAVFKIRKALNPKSAIKPTTLVKAAASKSKSKSKSSKSKS